MPDYMYMLESRLSPEQRAAMIRVQEVAVQTGSNIYLVGGAVRDALPSSTSPFVSFTPDHRLAFKESQNGLSGVVPEEPMAQKHYTLERDSPR